MTLKIHSILPHVNNYTDSSQEAVKASITLPSNYIGFQGHFPNAPILPSIYHGLIATELVSRQMGKTLTIKNLSHGKFVSPILPNTPFVFEGKIRNDEETLQLSASFTDGNGGNISKFKLILVS